MPEDDPPTDGAEGDESRAEDSNDQPLPDDIVAEAERLTRLAREAVDDAAATVYRDERADLLTSHDYVARVREDENGDVLVLHPDEWVDDGLIRPDNVDDVDRGIETPLEGPGTPEEWSAVADHNEAVAEAVARRHGEVHGANATAFAEFMSNHYAKPVESATSDEKEEFRTDYFRRNAWPSDEQRAVVEESLDLIEMVASELSDTPR